MPKSPLWNMCKGSSVKGVKLGVKPRLRTGEMEMGND